MLFSPGPTLREQGRSGSLAASAHSSLLRTAGRQAAVEAKTQRPDQDPDIEERKFTKQKSIKLSDAEAQENQKLGEEDYMQRRARYKEKLVARKGLRKDWLRQLGSDSLMGEEVWSDVSKWPDSDIVAQLSSHSVSVEQVGVKARSEQIEAGSRTRVENEDGGMDAVYKVREGAREVLPEIVNDSVPEVDDYTAFISWRQVLSTGFDNPRERVETGQHLTRMTFVVNAEEGVPQNADGLSMGGADPETMGTYPSDDPDTKKPKARRLDKVGGGRFSYGNPLSTTNKMECSKEKAERADALKLLRRHLYRYGLSLRTDHDVLEGGTTTNVARNGNVHVSVDALERQNRMIGLPPVEGGHFLQQCKVHGKVPGLKWSQVADARRKLADAQDEGAQEVAEKELAELEAAYKRAGEYRTEVGRLWWKLWTDQQPEVRNTAMIFAGMVSKTDANKSSSDAPEDQTKYKKRPDGTISNEMRREMLQDDFGDNMVLSVTELGNRGILKPGGDIYPKYAQNVDRVKEKREADDDAGGDSSVKGITVNTVPDYILDESEDAKGDPRNTRVSDEFAQPGGRHSIVQSQDWTWPLVRIGRTPRWLDWALPLEEEESIMWTSISKKNVQHHGLLSELFKDDGELAERDEGDGDGDDDDEGDDDEGDDDEGDDDEGDDDSPAWSTDISKMLMREINWGGGAADLPPSLRPDASEEDAGRIQEHVDGAWGIMDDVFGDLVDACPWWAFSYLSCRLVKSFVDARFQSATATKLASGASTFIDCFDLMPPPEPQGVPTAIRVKGEDELAWMSNEDRASYNKLANKHNDLVSIGHSRELDLVVTQLYDIEDKHLCGNILWRPYPSLLLDDVKALDAKGERMDGIENPYIREVSVSSWAQEQLLRCVLLVQCTYDNAVPVKLYNIEPYVNSYTNFYSPAPRDFTRDTMTPGSWRMGLTPAKYYKQWYMEKIELLPPCSEPGMLVVCSNMWPFYESNTPWYAHAQGRSGEITEINVENSPLVTLSVKTEYRVDSELLKENRDITHDDGFMVVHIKAKNVFPVMFDDPLRYGDRVSVDVVKILNTLPVSQAIDLDARAAAAERAADVRRRLSLKRAYLVEDRSISTNEKFVAKKEWSAATGQEVDKRRMWMLVGRGWVGPPKLFDPLKATVQSLQPSGKKPLDEKLKKKLDEKLIEWANVVGIKKPTPSEKVSEMMFVLKNHDSSQLVFWPEGSGMRKVAGTKEVVSKSKQTNSDMLMMYSSGDLQSIQADVIKEEEVEDVFREPGFGYIQDVDPSKPGSVQTKPGGALPKEFKQIVACQVEATPRRDKWPIAVENSIETVLITDAPTDSLNSKQSATVEKLAAGFK